MYTVTKSDNIGIVVDKSWYDVYSCIQSINKWTMKGEICIHLKCDLEKNLIFKGFVEYKNVYKSK